MLLSGVTENMHNWGKSFRFLEELQAYKKWKGQSVLEIFHNYIKRHIDGEKNNKERIIDKKLYFIK